MGKFELGRLVETAGVNEKRKDDRYFDIFVKLAFGRYSKGDWGDTCKEDKDFNNFALKHGKRILAVRKLQVQVEHIREKLQ